MTVPLKPGDLVYMPFLDDALGILGDVGPEIVEIHWFTGFSSLANTKDVENVGCTVCGIFLTQDTGYGWSPGDLNSFICPPCKSKQDKAIVTELRERMGMIDA